MSLACGECTHDIILERGYIQVEKIPYCNEGCYKNASIKKRSQEFQKERDSREKASHERI